MKKWFTICKTEQGWIVVHAGYLDEKLSVGIAAGAIASFDNVDAAIKYILACLNSMHEDGLNFPKKK